MDPCLFSIDQATSWQAWLDRVTPVAVQFIDKMNRRAIPVAELRGRFEADAPAELLPPDLPGVYGFFTHDLEDPNPLVKFGESFELFARLVSHLGVRPRRKPIRYELERNSFSGDSSFRLKIARALGAVEDASWKLEKGRIKADLRGNRKSIAQKVNDALDRYRVAWQPLQFGRAEIELWAEWSNEKDNYRRKQMAPHALQARVKPAFDRSLFQESPEWWRTKLALHCDRGPTAGL